MLQVVPFSTEQVNLGEQLHMLPSRHTVVASEKLPSSGGLGFGVWGLGVRG